MSIAEIPEYKRAFIQGLTLFDDIFFMKVFDGRADRTEQLLRASLGKPDIHVTESVVQSVIPSVENRSVVLDVKATDSAGRIYAIEIQQRSGGAAPKRARGISSILDSRILQKGEDFDALVETYTIFICRHDVLKLNKAVYTIDRFIGNAGFVPFMDDAHIVYVNGAWRGDDAVGDLMHDFSCSRPEDMRNGYLRDAVREYKDTDEGVREMSEYEEKYFKGREEKTRLETVLAIVKNMLKNNFSPDVIAANTGLPLEEVQKLANS